MVKIRYLKIQFENALFLYEVQYFRAAVIEMSKRKSKEHCKANAEASNQPRQGADEKTPKQNSEHSSDGSGNNGEAQQNRGTLEDDATMVPQYIGYPTDTCLLAEVREQSEGLIDKLYERSNNLWKKKPRTYRRIAAKKYLAFSKKRTRSAKVIKQTRKQQLNYLGFNMKTIDKMLDKLEASGKLIPFAHKDLKRLWVIQELYRQKKILVSDRRRISDRIDFNPFAEGTLLFEQI